MLIFLTILFCRLTIDTNYVGEPPEIELTIENLNDNVDKNFLSDMFSRANILFDDVTIFYHPDTNKHLGLARVILKSSKYMKQCLEKFDKKSVMGKSIHVFHDPYGEKCRNLYETLTSEKKVEPLPPLPTAPLPTFQIPEFQKLSDPIKVEFVAKSIEPPPDDHWSNSSSKYREKEYGEWDYGRKQDDEYRTNKYHDKYESRKDRERDRGDRERDRDRDYNNKYYHYRDDSDRSDRHKRDKEKDRRRDYKDGYRDHERPRKEREYYEYKEKERYGSSSRSSTSKYNKDYDGYYNYQHQSSYSSSSNSWQPPPPPKKEPEDSPPRPPPPEPLNDEENGDGLNELKPDDAETTVDLDTRIAMLFNSKSFDANIPFKDEDLDKNETDVDGESSQNHEIDIRKLKIEEDGMEDGEIGKSPSVSDISTIGSVPSPFESCETYKSYLKVHKCRKRKRQQRAKHKVESASDISSSEDELLAKGSYSPPLPRGSKAIVKKEDDQMSLSSLSSTEPTKDEFDIKTFGSYMYPVGFSSYQSAYYNNFHNFQQPNQKHRQNETNDPHEVAVKKVIDKLTLELKQILKKDFNKRMIEMTAFKKYEAWWDDQERSKNTRVIEEPTTVKESVKTTTPFVESVLQTPSLPATNFSYQQSGTLGILRNLRFQRIKRQPAKVSTEDSRKSDDEDVVQGSDDEKEDFQAISKTSYIQRVAPSISSESSESSDESSDDDDEDEEERDDHAYSSDTASIITDDDILGKKPVLKKEKENIRIYSDSDSDELDEKPGPIKTSVAKIYSDSDEDEGEPAPPGVDPEELLEEKKEIEEKIEPIKKPDISPTTESESDFNEDVPPRTPGRSTSSDDKEVLTKEQNAQKKLEEQFNDRMYSDSEEEREYQERIRRNTEWMEQIEREAKEELERKRLLQSQRKETDIPKEPSPMKEIHSMTSIEKPDKLSLPSKVLSIDEPYTPSTSLPPPTPGASITTDPFSNHLQQDASKKKRGRPKGSVGKPKEPKESKKVKNGAFAQPQPQQNVPLQKYSLKLSSPYSSDGGSSHASLVAQEHCYSLPPSASPSLSSSPHDIHMDHDYCGPSKNDVQPLQSIQPAQLDEQHKKEGPRPVGRPRKDPNAPKAQYNKKDKQQHPPLPKSPQKEKFKKVVLKQHQQMVDDFVPVQRFNKRTQSEEFEVICRFFTEGVDQEDIEYMKRAYTYLIQNDIPGTEMLHEVHWVDHCSTDRSFEPPPTKKRRKDEPEKMKEHKTGCARTEGYYKMDLRDKARYKYHLSRGGVSTSDNNAASLAVQKMQSASREARSNQRRLLTAFGATESDLLKFNQLKFRKKQIKFAKSGIHDWGLFAMEPIAADEMVIEYVGQMVRSIGYCSTYFILIHHCILSFKVRPSVADLRESKYEAIGIGSSYLFRVDLETIIDATKCGNLARFINHSCNVSSKKNFETYSSNH